jgi:hypothetical protein
LLTEQEQCGDGRGVQSLVQARIVDRRFDAQKLWNVAIGCRDFFGSGDCSR